LNLRCGGEMLRWGTLMGIGCLLACTREVRPLPEVPEGPQTSKEGEAVAAAAQKLDWSYSGASGPEQWAGLKPEWAACGGQDQSPIDVPLDLLSPSKKPATDGAKAPAGVDSVKSWTPQFAALPLEAQSDGRLVELSGALAQGLSIDGRLAQLSRLELHVPAEHTLGGAHADAEVVLWMRDSQQGDVALSLLFRTGAEHPELNALIDRLPKSLTYKTQLLGGTFALPSIVPADAQVFAYSGSLSRPPCTTGVLRLVVARVGELSAEQLGKLKAALPGASGRPIQPMGERQVSLIQFSGQASSTASSPAAPSNAPSSIVPSAPSTPKTSK
jgi:carbonic anhydrase